MYYLKLILNEYQQLYIADIVKIITRKSTIGRLVPIKLQEILVAARWDSKCQRLKVILCHFRNLFIFIFFIYYSHHLLLSIFIFYPHPFSKFILRIY